MSYIIYIPSALSEGHVLRDHCFTRWISPTRLKETVNALGLLPIYAEHNDEHQSRYILWRPPEGMSYEARSSRKEPAFTGIDQANIENQPIISLHINGQGFYSGVWVSRKHYDVAVSVMAAYGISPASRVVQR